MGGSNVKRTSLYVKSKAEEMSAGLAVAQERLADHLKECEKVVAQRNAAAGRPEVVQFVKLEVFMFRRLVLLSSVRDRWVKKLAAARSTP